MIEIKKITDGNKVSLLDEARAFDALLGDDMLSQELFTHIQPYKKKE